MNPWVVVGIAFGVIFVVAYLLLSWWAGQKLREFRERMKKYTGPW